MSEFFANMFNPSIFEAHNTHFYPDHVGLMWFIILGNGLIFLAYVLIPIAILYFVRKRTDILFQPIFIWFALFIILCGFTHAMHIVIFWYGLYYLESVLLFATGVVSIVTFFLLLKVIPLALQLKTPKQLDEILDKVLGKKQGQ